jgi:hypothetical protein
MRRERIQCSFESSQTHQPSLLHGFGWQANQYEGCPP